MLDPTRIPRGKNLGDRIALFGPMCVGKTHIAKWLEEEYGYTRIAFADELKRIAKEMLGVEKKDAKSRVIYQQLGDTMRALYDDVWIKPVLDKVARYPKRAWVVDDVRYVNEYEALEKAGFIMARVTVPERIRQERIRLLYPDTDASTQQHSSETALGEYEGHVTLLSDNGSVFPDVEKVVFWGK